MGYSLLDKDNFVIDSTGWEIQDAIGVVHGQRVPIKVKVHPEWDVWEYVSGVPQECIGQQLFTFSAALRETQKLGKSLPSDIVVLEHAIASMQWSTDNQKYAKYLQVAEITFCGCYSSGLHVFDDIGQWAYYRLDDGTRVALWKNTWNVARRDESMGYMISLW